MEMIRNNRIKITSTNDEMRESHIIKRQLYTVRVNNSTNINKTDTFTSNHLAQIDHVIWPCTSRSCPWKATHIRWDYTYY
jgi:hypothetical protein